MRNTVTDNDHNKKNNDKDNDSNYNNSDDGDTNNDFEKDDEVLKPIENSQQNGMWYLHFDTVVIVIRKLEIWSLKDAKNKTIILHLL